MQMTRPSVAPVKAKYHQCGILEHDSNPLVAALPPIRNDTQWLEQLLAVPSITAAHRAAESHIRAHYVSRIKRLFIPDSAAKQLARRMDVLIRDGLVARNPLAPDRALRLQAAYDRGQAGEVSRVLYSEEAPISSFSLFGVSGMGKSTAMGCVLAAFPQYILHEEHHLHQVVWLKVETPKDGSVRELGINILRAFDQVLGTDHATKINARTNVNEILRNVAVLAITHALGVLVIDEIQNISVKKSGGRQEVLNWFQELVNELRLPVVLMGTPKAHKLFESEIRHARRAGVSGSAFWKPLAPGDEFDTLLGQLWELLVLRNAGELTDAMRDAVYDQTQGIKAFMADMLLVTELHALRAGREDITPEFFTHVAKTEFAPVQRFITAFRSKEPQRLAKYDDICDYDIEDLIDRTHTSLAASIAAGNRAARETESLVDRAIRNVLTSLPIDEAAAREFVLQAAADETRKTASALTQAAIRAYVDSTRAPAAA